MRKQLLFIILTVVLCVPLLTGRVQAWSAFSGVCNNPASNSAAVCKDSSSTSDPVSGPNGVVIKITNIIATVAGVAATIILILAGLRYIQSSGNTDDVAGARRTIIYATVGLVVIVLARTLIVLVVAGIG